MGQLERLEEEKKGRRTAARILKKANSPYAVFHPTAEERTILSSGTYGVGEALTVIMEKLAAGCTLTLGHKAENGSFFAVIREKTPNWETAPALSCWHGDVQRALIGLGYALETRYSGFPEGNWQISLIDNDW